jgi:type II secretory pathway component PulJ
VRTADSEQGSVLLPTLIAAVVGAVLAVGASVVLVQTASDSGAAPVQKPLITYDER